MSIFVDYSLTWPLHLHTL